MFSKTDIEKYFLAEKQVSGLFVILGIVSIVLALLFFFLLRSQFYKGAAWPLLLIGAIQLVASIAVYKRSDEDRIRNVYSFGMDPDRLKQEELPRIKKVNHDFVLYHWTEGVLLAAGLVLLFYFKSNSDRQFWYGFGLALALQAAIMLGADWTAAQRAQQYTKGMESFIEKLR
jgi:hypothetical protein